MTPPDCDLANARALYHSIGLRGVLKLTAEPRKPAPDKPALTLRLCVDCVWDVCLYLREDGYVNIHITAPEAQKLQAWKG